MDKVIEIIADFAVFFFATLGVWFTIMLCVFMNGWTDIGRLEMFLAFAVSAVSVALVDSLRGGE